MKSLPSIIIFSADRATLSLADNSQASSLCEQLMQEQGIEFQALVGRYKDTHEVSFLVSAVHEQAVKALCETFDQECYLLSGANRETVLVYPHGTPAYIGILRPATYEEATSKDAYTIHPELGYFIVD